jgi:hypothetical protein
MAEMSDRPELAMVRRAAVPAVIAFGLSVAAGWILGGPATAASAGLGIAVVVANFAAHAASRAWASTISVGVVMAVALGGVVMRLAVIVAAMFALAATSWFSPLAFGLAVVPATLLLLGFEARLAIDGLGADLQIPADTPAVRAGRTLSAREAR